MLRREGIVPRLLGEFLCGYESYEVMNRRWACTGFFELVEFAAKCLGVQTGGAANVGEILLVAKKIRFGFAL
jgi:hypothetical protein